MKEGDRVLIVPCGSEDCPCSHWESPRRWLGIYRRYSKEYNLHTVDLEENGEVYTGMNYTDPHIKYPVTPELLVYCKLNA